MEKIKKFICCRMSKEHFYEYEKMLMFIVLFWMMLYYVVIFILKEKGIILVFPWLLQPIFTLLYIPLIHSFAYHIKNRDFKIKLIDILFIIYIVFCLIATIYSKNQKYSLWGKEPRYEGLVTIIMYFLVYLLARNMVNKNNIIELLNLLLTFGIVQVISGLIQSYTRYMAYFGEMAYGFASNPNMFGILIGLLAIIAICLYLSNSENTQKYKKFYLFCSSFFFIGLVISESAGPFFTFIAMLFVVCIYYLIKKTNLKCIGILLILFFILFPMVQISNEKVNEYYLYGNKKVVSNNNVDYAKLSTDIEKIIKILIPKNDVELKDTISIGNVDESKISNSIDSGRLSEWKYVIREIKENLINGVGMDCLYIHYTERGYLQILDEAHNNYLDICVSIGVLGCIIYIIMLLLIFVKGLISKKPLVKILFFGFTYYSIAIFINISVPFSAMYYYIVVGFLIGLYEEK